MSKLYYSIGEVSEKIEVKPYIIRYWETEFSQLKSKNSRSRNRRYTQKDINLLLQIKGLIYEKKFTLEGAKKAVLEEVVKQKDKKEATLTAEVQAPITNRLQNLQAELLQIKKLLLQR